MQTCNMLHLPLSYQSNIARMLLITNSNHDRDCDDDQICICEQNRDRDQDLNLVLPATTQENKSKLESLRRENAKLRADEEKRRVDKSKLEKKRDDKVRSEHLAADTSRPNLSLNHVLVNQ